jgi:hypothetical protein
MARGIVRPDFRNNFSEKYICRLVPFQCPVFQIQNTALEIERKISYKQGCQALKNHSLVPFPEKAVFFDALIRSQEPPWTLPRYSPN